MYVGFDFTNIADIKLYKGANKATIFDGTVLTTTRYAAPIANAETDFLAKVNGKTYKRTDTKNYVFSEEEGKNLLRIMTIATDGSEPDRRMKRNNTPTWTSGLPADLTVITEKE